MEKIEKVDLGEVNRGLTVAEGPYFDKRITEYTGYPFDKLAPFYPNASLKSEKDESRFPLELISYEPEGVIHIYFDEKGICTDTFFFSNKDLEGNDN